MFRNREQRGWPGLDGWVLLAFAGVVVGTWLMRDRVGPDLHIALLVGLDAVYLGSTWWSRR